MLNLFQLFDFSCQPVSSVLRSRIRADWERDPVPFLVPCPNPLCSPLHGAAAVYKQYVGSRGAQIYLSQYEMGGRHGRGADEPKWNRAIFFFFFFSTKKNGNRNAPSLPKVVPYYTLMYAHKHSLTHTQTQSHAPSIVIRGQNMIVMFSTVASLRMSFILFSRRRAPHKRILFLKKKTINKKTLRSESRKKIYIIFSKKRKSIQPPTPRTPDFSCLRLCFFRSPSSQI